MRDQIKEGMRVESSDGTNLGKVVRLEADRFVIEKGFFFPKDYLVRYADCRSVEADTIHLSLSDEALRRAEEGDTLGREEIAGATTAGREPAAMGTGTQSQTEEKRIPLAEEEITATKQAKEAGRVRVKKDVVTEEKQVTVPVTKEEVRVERVPASGEAAATGIGEGTIDVPVMEEEVEIQKRPVVREEVRVGKDVSQESRTATEEVRREEADIETTGTVGKTDEELHP